MNTAVSGSRASTDWTNICASCKKRRRKMTASNAKPSSVAEAAEVAFTRTFDAPRNLVWKAWTDSRYLAQWWGPHSFSNPVCEVDARIGGAIRIHMRGPDGPDYRS